MLEKPPVSDEAILACLRDAYGLCDGAALTFLPLGADVHTAVYRLECAGQAYFLKLRSGPFNPAAILAPKYLHDLGIAQVIPPLPTIHGRLWAQLDGYAVILSPFVAGQDGYERPLNDRHWTQFGRALRGIHSAPVPPELAAHIPREDYSAHYRRQLHTFLERAAREEWADPVAGALAALLREEQAVILGLITRAEALATGLRRRPLAHVLCHADLHAGNLLMNDDNLYIVDWDTLTLAPKERDLMYIGGALLGNYLSPQEEAARFYPAYGAAPVDPDGLAYYRCERIIQDLVAYCEELLLTDAGGQDRARSLEFVRSNFLPGHTIEQARIP